MLQGLVALSVAMASSGCAGGWGMPRPFRSRPVAVYRPDLPAFAPALQISERPGKPQKQIMADVSPLPPPPMVVPDDLLLSTPPLIAQGPPATTDTARAPMQPAGDVRTMHRLACERIAAIPGYAVRLHRREQINGLNRPEETLDCKFRTDPWSISLKWIGAEGKNRELVYVKGQHGNQVHMLTAAGDSPLLPVAGKHLKLAPEHTLIRAVGRYPIPEVGIAPLIERFGTLVAAGESGGGAASLQYLGVLKRTETDHPVEGVIQMIPAATEPGLPEGGERMWFFDVSSRLPIVMTTHNVRGQEVEYYWYDNITFPVQLSDNDFDPDNLWPS
jgi:hypothetical protein